MKDKDKFTELHRHKGSSNRNEKGASPSPGSSSHGTVGGFPTNGSSETTTIDKFAFTDEDESVEDKKLSVHLSLHRSTERKRRGKISRGIHHLWSLLPVDSKGNNTKETLVGMLDKVAAYIEDTQEKLRVCFLGQADQVQAAQMEALQQKVKELTEQNQKYMEALRLREIPDFLTSQPDVTLHWKGKGSSSSAQMVPSATQSVASPADNQVTMELDGKDSISKEGKKQRRSSTVSEHLQRLENARSEKQVDGANPGSLGSLVTSTSPFLGMPMIPGLAGNPNGPMMLAGGGGFPGSGLMALRPSGVGGLMNIAGSPGMMMMSPNMTSMVPMSVQSHVNNPQQCATSMTSQFSQGPTAVSSHPNASSTIRDSGSATNNETGKNVMPLTTVESAVPQPYNFTSGAMAGAGDVQTTVQNTDSNGTMVTQSINMNVPLMSATQSGMNPLLQGPQQTPLVNMPMMSTNQQAGMHSMQIPGMASLQGNLVLQNGQLVLVNNDLTSAAMAAAGIPQGMLGTPTGVETGDATPKLSENERASNGVLPSSSESSTPIPTPVGTPVSENPPMTSTASTWIPVSVSGSVANTGATNLLAQQFSMGNMNVQQTATSVAALNLQQSIVNSFGGNLTLPPGGTTGMPQVFFPPGVSAGMGVVNQSQATTSQAGVAMHGQPQNVMVNAAGQPIQMFPNQTPGFTGMPPMTFMTPQGQLMTMPQGPTPAPPQGGLVTLNTTPSTPNQFPSALILPNGQIVPVVTQPSLLFPQQGATSSSQVVMANNGGGIPSCTKPTVSLTGSQAMPQSATTQGQPALGSGLLMTTTTVSTATTTGGVKHVPGPAALLGQPPGAVTQSTLEEVPQHTLQTSTPIQSGVTSTAIARTQAPTNVTSVTYSSGTRLPMASLSQPNLVQGGFPQPAVRPSTGVRPVMTTASSVPVVRAPLKVAAAVGPPNAVINKAGQMTLQQGQPTVLPAISTTATKGSPSQMVSNGGSVTGATNTVPTSNAALSTNSSSALPSTPGTPSTLPSLPLTAVVSADGSIVLSLPPGAQSGNFMLDPNALPSFIAGLPSGGSNGGVLPSGVKKVNKKSGQRVLMPKPPVGSGPGMITTIPTINSAPGQTGLWGAPLVAPPAPTSSGDKGANSTAISAPVTEQVATTSPLTINTSDSNTPAKTTSLSSSSNASAPDILARAAESIFSTSCSAISPPISSFYNTANEENALQIDTSAGETPAEVTEPSNSMSAPTFKTATPTPKSKKSGSSSSSKRSKKKKVPLPALSLVQASNAGGSTAPLQPPGPPAKSPRHSIASPKPCPSPMTVPVPSPVMQSPMQSPLQLQQLGPSPMHSAFGDDNDGMVIDLQSEQHHQSPPNQESDEGVDASRNAAHTFTSNMTNLSMPQNFETSPAPSAKNTRESTRTIEPSAAIEFHDVVESSLVASGIKMETVKSPRQSSAPVGLLSPLVTQQPEEPVEKSHQTKSSGSSKEKSKSKHRKSKSLKHSSSRSTSSTSSVRIDMPHDFMEDVGVHVSPVVSTTLTDVPVSISASISLSSPKHKKKSSSKKTKRIHSEVILPDTITFTESELSEVLDQVESLDSSTKSSSHRKHKSTLGYSETPSKRKRSEMVGTELTAETENSDSMTTDILERAMKDIGPLDIDLSEPESLPEAPVFSRLLSSENKMKTQGASTEVTEENDDQGPPEELQSQEEETERLSSNTKPENAVCGSLKINVSTAQHPNLPTLISTSQPQHQASPPKSIFDSVSSLVATSSATTTQPVSLPVNTIASSTSTTTDTFSHSIFSMPSLMSSQSTTPMELSPTLPSNLSCSTPALSPPAISSGSAPSDFDSKPIARHTNLVSLAQTVALPTPKHPGSMFIAHKQMGSLSSNMAQPSSRSTSQSQATTGNNSISNSNNLATLSRGTMPQSGNSIVASSSNTALPTNTMTAAGSVNSMSSVGSDTEMDNSSMSKGMHGTKSDAVQSSSNLLASAGGQKGTQSTIGGMPSVTKPISNRHSSTDSNSSIAGTPLSVPLVTSGLTMPLTHINKPLPQTNLPQSCQDGMPHKSAPSPGRLDHQPYSSQSQGTKGSHSQSASPASSFTSPPHTNYSAELLFSPSASSTTSKSPSEHNHQPQTQNLNQVQGHMQSQPPKAPGNMSERPQHRPDSNAMQHQQQPQPQQRSNFYSAENMVSKSGPGFGGVKESGPRDGTACSTARGGPQEPFNFMLRGPSTTTGTSTFSFTLSSTTNTTTTSSNSTSPYGGTTSQPQFSPFYPIPGVPNQQRLRVPPPGLSHPPLQPSQVGMTMFMNQNNLHAQQGAGSNHHSLPPQTSNPERMTSPGVHNQRRNQFTSFMGEGGISHGREQNQFILSDQPRHHLGNHEKSHTSDSLAAGGIHSSNSQGTPGSQLGRSGSVGRPSHISSDVSFYSAPNFQAAPGGPPSNNPPLPTPPLHHPARPPEQAPAAPRPNFEQPMSHPSNQQFSTIHHPDFNSPNFEPQALQFSRSANTNTPQSQPSSYSSSENVRLQKSSNQNRPVEPTQQQPPPQQQQPQPQQPQQHRSKSLGSSSNSKGHLQKTTRSKQKKSAAALRCEVDTNLSNSIFESGRSMTPLFPMAGLSPPPTRQLQSDGPTYLPANLFSNAGRPLSNSNPLQHKNAELNGPFNPLFQPSRPQNGLGLNFQPGFGMNSVHSNHVTSSQMITPHSNAGPVTHMPNFNLSNIFPDVNGPGGQPDSLNISPIKFTHGNAILQSQAGLEHNGLQHHPHGPGASQLYHHNRSHPTPPQVIHNAMSINSILSHNHHGFDPRQMAPGINSTMTPPFGSHGHPAAFGMTPLNFPMHDH